MTEKPCSVSFYVPENTDVTMFFYLLWLYGGNIEKHLGCVVTVKFSSLKSVKMFLEKLAIKECLWI